MRIGFIYKITSPKKRVYIGQTVNPTARFKRYKYMDCKGQFKLYRSFLKYGFDKHKLEIIAECDESEINNLERYYQDLYHCVGANGLNLILTGTSARRCEHSDEAKKRRSEWMLANPRVIKDETRERLRASNTGKVHSEETRKRISEGRKGIPSWNKGLVRSAAHSKAQSEARKGKMGDQCKNSRLLFNTETGIYYYGATEAVMALGRCNPTCLNRMISGKKINKTMLIAA